MFRTVAASAAERRAIRPGDDLVNPADVVMDRAVIFDAAPETVWPWLVQLGKQRAGWYLPRRVERVLPAGRRATRQIQPRWQHLQAGDIIPDYGGRHETFRVDRIHAPDSIVYTSRRGRTHLTWSITLEPESVTPHRTRVHFRLRMAPVKHRWLATTVGEFIDALTIAGAAAGLTERLRDARSPTA
jgi:hypothetical protein